MNLLFLWKIHNELCLKNDSFLDSIQLMKNLIQNYYFISFNVITLRNFGLERSFSLASDCSSFLSCVFLDGGRVQNARRARSKTEDDRRLKAERITILEV